MHLFKKIKFSKEEIQSLKELFNNRFEDLNGWYKNNEITDEYFNDETCTLLSIENKLKKFIKNYDEV